MNVRLLWPLTVSLFILPLSVGAANMCQYFPEPAQSWISTQASKLELTNTTSQITGWSDGYLSDPANIFTYSQGQYGNEWDNLRVGFDSVSDTWMAYQNPNTIACGEILSNKIRGCYPGNRSAKVLAPIPLPNSSILFTSKINLNLQNGSINDTNPNNLLKVCPEDNSSPYCVSRVLSDESREVTIKSDVKELIIINNHASKIIVKFALSSALYGLKIEKYEVTSGSVQTLFDKDGEFTFGSFNIAPQSSELNIAAKVKINIKEKFEIHNSARLVTTYYPDDFYLYGPEAEIIFNTAQVNFYGLFVAKSIAFNNPVNMYGAVTTNHLTLKNNAKIIGKSSCIGGKDNYQLQLTPTHDYSLICQTQRLKFQVQDSKGQSTGSFSGTINITKPANANLTLVDGKGTGGSGSYKPNANGELWFSLSLPKGSGSQIVPIEGVLNPQGSSGSVTGTYHFVPYKFATQEQYVIANKPQAVEVKVLACNDDGEVVDVNYSGTPQVSSAWVAPTSDVVQGDLTFTPVFTQGVANSELTMEDSGHKTVALEDGSFDCSELGDDCPIEGNTTLKGSFEVYSRPWTFAICSTENTDLDRATGTSSSGEGFLAAGQMFDAQIIPIKYQEKGLTAGEILSTSELCKEAKFTSNFFIENTSNEQTDKLVQLSSMVASPDAPLSSDLLMSSDDGGLSKARVNSNKKYLFSNLFWSDVGSLKVMAAMAGYDDECKKPSGLAQWYNCTQIGYRNIGRFYPAYFKLTESKWWIDDQNNIAYLSQPYNKAQFVIVPYALDGGRVKNYADFGSEVIAQIDGLDDEKYPSRLLVDIASGKWLKDADDTTQWSVILGKEYKNAAVFNRKYQLTESGSDKLTVEGKQFSMVDGPFNIPSQSLIFDEQSTRTHFGLTVEGVDPVEARVNIEQRKPEIECINYVDEQQLNSCQLTFPVQPPARYGRMVMDDVGGTSVSKIAIPLRVEYWQGSRFTTNHADSGSVYATLDNYICKQTLWPSPSSPSNAKLSGSDTEPWTKVSQGQSKQLVAEPHATEDTQGLREQIRFWLRLDNDQTNLEDNKRSPQVGEEGVNCGTQYTSQPWLQYNWFARGDEDPSAVVTFGIHRGNDKIIFRGETRLSGQ